MTFQEGVHLLIPHLFILRFAAFGAGESTSLRVYRRDANINDRDVDEQEDPQDDETNSATVNELTLIYHFNVLFTAKEKLSHDIYYNLFMLILCKYLTGFG